MKFSPIARALAFYLGLVLLYSSRAQSLDGIVVITNPANSETSLELATLKDIYTGRKMFWKGGLAIVIVVYDATNAAVEQVSGMNPSQFKTHWQRLGFSGRGKPPRKADTVEGLIAAVASTPGAIALAPVQAAELKGVVQMELK